MKKYFYTLLTQEVIGHLLNGAQAISHHYNEEKQAGFLLLKLANPIKETDGDREWHYLHYEIHNNKFYLAASHVKMTDKQANKWAWDKFRN